MQIRKIFPYGNEIYREAIFLRTFRSQQSERFYEVASEFEESSKKSNPNTNYFLVAAQRQISSIHHIPMDFGDIFHVLSWFHDLPSRCR